MPPAAMTTITPCKLGHERKRTPDGSIICPECRRIMRENNREKLRESSKRNWEKNKEKIKEKRANWSPERKEQVAAYLKEYRQENAEELAAKAKIFREENAEEISARRKIYYEEHREEILTKIKRYYQENREDRLKYAKYFREEMMHPLYKIWDGIKQRCFNPTDKNYENYGKDGITMCDRWRYSFDDFVTDVGERPSLVHSIDRYPNRKGNYEPGNWRWATPEEQANNRRDNEPYRQSTPDNSSIRYQNRDMPLFEFSQITGLHLLAAKYRYAMMESAEYILDWEWDNRNHIWKNFGYTVTELSAIANVSYKTMHNRLFKYGWSVEKAMEGVE